MSLELYNTRTRKLEEITWPKDHEVGLYTCGPTVYNSAHIGNLRTYIFEDVLKRVLEFNDYRVKHVMNITDVGHLTGDGDMGKDKVEEQAKAEQKSAYDIAAFHTKEFFDDLERLNIEIPPQKNILKATDTIDWQIDLIKKLEANGFTYRTSDGIYYDTSKYDAYGSLSGQKASDKKAGARVEVNDEKKQPSDFALWKFSKPEDKRQMEWPSPWGTGFPGWHIECSAMSIHEFPHGLDIHCGGIDHIPVHHENEIAQNEGAGFHDFVNIWMHGEFLKLPGKRMGKSEGNAITLQQVIDKGIDPLAYRFLCLQTGYRKPLTFSEDSLFAALRGLMSIWMKISKFEEGGAEPLQDYVHEFERNINDDLNTSDGIALLSKLLGDPRSDQEKIATVKVIDKVLALNLSPELVKKRFNSMKVDLSNDPLLQAYSFARQEKRFTESDKIRQQFADKGIVIEDTPEGPRLRKK